MKIRLLYLTMYVGLGMLLLLILTWPAQAQSISPCLPPTCLVLPFPQPIKPVSDVISRSQIVPPPIMPYVLPSFTVHPLAPPSPPSSPLPTYIPPPQIVFVPELAPVPQVSIVVDDNSSLASLLAQPQATQNYVAVAQARAQFAQANHCTWYRGKHWYSTPQCIRN